VTDEDVRARELRPVGRDRLVEHQPPLFDQLEQTDRDEPLRPGEDQDEVVALTEVDDELAVDRGGEEPVLERVSNGLEARRDDQWAGWASRCARYPDVAAS